MQELLRKYKVRLKTKNGMFAQYNGVVEIYAPCEESAIILAKIKVRRAVFSDYILSMLVVEGVDTV